LVKPALKIFLIILCLFSSEAAKSQDDLKDIELTQEQWEAVRDTFAVYAIKFLARLDTLQLEIDSLKNLNEQIENYDCEKELYALVGASKQDVADFRRKFEETEKKINGRIGTPAEIRKMYFDEIQNSKIKCLPEFSERYNKMYSVMSNIVVTEIKIPEGTYSVVKGDCLWKISSVKYNTPYLWPAIWDANKSDINNPDLIYPGQVLKIPKVSDTEMNEALEKSKIYRKIRRKKENSFTQ
jgi:LysM repeat protein